MGKKSAKAPDYTALAEVSREAIAVGKDLGQQTIDFAKTQYEEMKPYLQNIADLQAQAQQQQMDQAKDYYDYQVSTFRPVEQGLVADAEAFSTESYRQRMAGDAAAAAGRAFANTQKSLERSDAARGLNPNSPAARAARQQAALGLAASSANAQTNAYDRAEQMGWARRLDVTGLGRGLAGASTAAYGGATGAGSAAAGTAQMAGNQYMAGLGQGAGTYMSGYSTGMQGLQGILDSQTSMYNTGVGAQSEMYGAAMGMAGGLMMSDRRLKEDIVFMYEDHNSGLNIYEFSYKGEPNRRFLGVMADEVEAVFPDAVEYGEDGYAAVDYAMLGMRMIEVTGEGEE